MLAERTEFDMTEQIDYAHLGRWVSEIPTHCADPDHPHRLDPNRTISGWVDCRCGGHRTVRCLSYHHDVQCNAVHYLPEPRPACSCVPARAPAGVS